jgi:hypothetical protein
MVSDCEVKKPKEKFPAHFFVNAVDKYVVEGPANKRQTASF